MSPEHTKMARDCHRPGSVETTVGVLDKLLHMGDGRKLKELRRVADQVAMIEPDFEAMSGMLGFLMEDCCGGAPEICAPLAQVVERAKGCRAA